MDNELFSCKALSKPMCLMNSAMAREEIPFNTEEMFVTLSLWEDEKDLVFVLFEK